MQKPAKNSSAKTLALIFGLGLFGSIPRVWGKTQATIEWALFNQVLLIGIVVSIIVLGMLFYAVIKYREKPQKAGAPTSGIKTA